MSDEAASSGFYGRMAFVKGWKIAAPPAEDVARPVSSVPAPALPTPTSTSHVGPSRSAMFRYLAHPAHEQRREAEPLTPVAAGGKRPTARVVIVENGLVWAVQPKHEAVWVLPGGGVDPGEPYDIAAIREAKEEVGFDVEVVELLFDVEEPGRCGACRALVEMGALEAGHPGCHRRYFHARRVGNEAAPTITDTDEIAKVMLVASTSLDDPHDRIAAAQVVADQGEDPTRHRDAFRTPDDME